VEGFNRTVGWFDRAAGWLDRVAEWFNRAVGKGCVWQEVLAARPESRLVQLSGSAVWVFPAAMRLIMRGAGGMSIGQRDGIFPELPLAQIMASDILFLPGMRVIL
jgi:hypothetical protein